MTPSNTSTHHDKTVIPTVEQSSNQSSESGHGCTQATSSNSESDAELESDLPAPDRTCRLLPASGGAYHAITDDGDPLCEAEGTFTAVPTSEAREKTRFCRNCKTLQEGHVDTRPCPKCGRLIRLTRWPQHLRTCRGQETDAADERVL